MSDELTRPLTEVEAAELVGAFNAISPRLGLLVRRLAFERDRLRGLIAEAEAWHAERKGEDGTDKLCRAVYGREAQPRDYLGGSEARMLHDAAALIARLRAESKEANP